MDDEARASRQVTAGTIGRPHGLDGSVRVSRPQHALSVGTETWVAGRPRPIVARRGTAERPIVRLEGVADRDAAAALAGELLLVDMSELPLEQGEWLAVDLIGCSVTASGAAPNDSDTTLGAVRRVLDGPSCDVLELEDGTLIPLVHDAVRSVDLPARRVDVDGGFLGLPGFDR